MRATLAGHLKTLSKMTMSLVMPSTNTEEVSNARSNDTAKKSPNSRETTMRMTERMHILALPNYITQAKGKRNIGQRPMSAAGRFLQLSNLV